MAKNKIKKGKGPVIKEFNSLNELNQQIQEYTEQCLKYESFTVKIKDVEDLNLETLQMLNENYDKFSIKQTLTLEFFLFTEVNDMINAANKLKILNKLPFVWIRFDKQRIQNDEKRASSLGFQQLMFNLYYCLEGDVLVEKENCSMKFKILKEGTDMTINLLDEKINDEDILYLTSFLSTLKTLDTLKLNIFQNPITDYGIDIICQYAIGMDNLKTIKLDIGKTLFTLDGLERFSTTLRSKKNLTFHFYLINGFEGMIHNLFLNTEKNILKDPQTFNWQYQMKNNIFTSYIWFDFQKQDLYCLDKLNESFRKIKNLRGINMSGGVQYADKKNIRDLLIGCEELRVLKFSNQTLTKKGVYDLYRLLRHQKRLVITVVSKNL